MTLARRLRTSHSPTNLHVATAACAGFTILASWMLLTSDVSDAVRLVGVAIGTVVSAPVALVYGVRHDLDVAPALAVPIAISAVQNVLLLPLASVVFLHQHLHILLSVNLVATALLLATAAFLERRQLRRRFRDWPASAGTALGVVLVVVAYALFSVVALGTPLDATVASSRNLLSIPVFLVLGILTARVATVRRYCTILVVLGWVVLAFGFVERFTSSIWLDLDLASLWAKKGIDVPAHGLPANWVSSEQLDGEQLRRMASTFADPVNLGTFLFVVFLAAWYLRRHLSAVLALAGCALAISKGALLGVLVFCLVAAAFYLTRRALVAIGTLCAGVAVLFWVYSLRSSTGSLTAHVNGLLDAFRELDEAPFGHGVGQSGVLAQLLSDGATLPSSSVESGAGVIIGQLGVVGIAAFGLLLISLVLDVRAVRHRRTAVLAWTLLFAFAANAAFNEVALSPNSAGPYFIILGLLFGQMSGLERSGSWAPVAPQVLPAPRGWALPALLGTMVAVGSFLLSLSSVAQYEASAHIDVQRDGVTPAKPPAAELPWKSGARPTSQEWLRQHARIANSWVVTDTAADAVGLRSGSELTAAGRVVAMPTSGRLRVEIEGRHPQELSRVVDAWAAETVATVLRRENRPPQKAPSFTRLVTGHTVVARPLTAAVTARHLLLALVTGVGVALVTALPWSPKRGAAARRTHRRPSDEDDRPVSSVCGSLPSSMSEV